TAVDGLDLDVPYGSVYGFLGPNGSGKTTTIRMLLGLLTPSDGRCEVLGKTIPDRARAVLPQVGALVEGPGFHPHLSGKANLRRLDAADPMADGATSARRIAAVLEQVGLEQAARKSFGRYSLGMKQRLGIAATLLRPRRLLILDEPTNGLDPQGTREIRSLISSLAADGLTIFMSTHLLSEVEQTCSHVGIMHRGSLKHQGTLDGLSAQVPRKIHIDSSRPEDVREVLRRFGLDAVDVDGARVTAPAGDVEPEKVLSGVVHDGIPVYGFQVASASLEELFIALTGEGFDSDA
ncbi:MAG: ABC transporter ATP-binding protein, partial [Stackebrandtia sp.]